MKKISLQDYLLIKAIEYDSGTLKSTTMGYIKGEENLMNKQNELLKPIDLNDATYHPSVQAMKKLVENMHKPRTQRAIVSGKIARTDGFDVDRTISDLEKRINDLPEETVDRKKLEGLLSRMLSVSDLTENLYLRFSNNKNSLFNWLKALQHALTETNSELICPKTKAFRLRIELAQFIRLEYQDTSKEDRALFNEIIYDQFGLEDGKTYFIKTGTFSSKFQFANAKCSEPQEMGEYFQVINNFAMKVGAGQTIDLVVREYIEDVEDNPTIYNGMPLRTEFRAFVDCDAKELIGVVPYWNPIVMKRALSAGLSDSMEADYQTYLKHENKLMFEYNKYLPKVKKAIQELLPELHLEGKYSIDVMKNGDDLYVIDLALMSESALTELL